MLFLDTKEKSYFGILRATLDFICAVTHGLLQRHYEISLQNWMT